MSFGDLCGSFMTGLLIAMSRQDKGQDQAEQFARLLQAVGWQAGPDHRRDNQTYGMDREEEGMKSGRQR